MNLVNCLEHTEGNVDPAKRITKIEADLCSKYEQSRQAAVAFMEFTGGIPPIPNSDLTWQAHRQQAGKGLFPGLQLHTA